MLEERLEKHIELLIKRYPELDGMQEDCQNKNAKN